MDIAPINGTIEIQNKSFNLFNIVYIFIKSKRITQVSDVGGMMWKNEGDFYIRKESLKKKLD